ncbi:MAG: F0F1 ATP synthase subunit epsilon [Paludibacteraceae bacterium]
MKLDIITPEEVYFSGEVTSVIVPGLKGSFTILNSHAPIISILTGGKLIYNTGKKEMEIKISGGVIEGHDNEVTISVEAIENE